MTGGMPESATVGLLLSGLAAMVRADPPSEAARYLRESSWYLGQLGIGDPELLTLVGCRWGAAETVPDSAEQNRQQVNVQIAEIVPGWFN